MEPTLVVGDVHGCVEELLELVRAVGAGRRLVLVGDLVAKGPDSQGVVQIARERGALAVLGNHDARVLDLRDPEALAAADRKPRIPHKGVRHAEVAHSLRPEDWHYLASLPIVLPLGSLGTGEPDAVVAHGGLVPGRALDEQDRDVVLTLRSLRADGSPSSRLDDGDPWASRWPGPAHVIFGHDALRGLQLYDHATGLDTGCVYGGRLTGILLPERRLVSIPARRAYVPVDG